MYCKCYGINHKHLKFSVQNISWRMRTGNVKLRLLSDSTSLLPLFFRFSGRQYYNYSWFNNSADSRDVSRISYNNVSDNSGYGRLNCRRHNMNNAIKSVWYWCLLPYFIRVRCGKISCRIFRTFNSSWWSASHIADDVIVYGLWYIFCECNRSISITVITVNYIPFCFNRECYNFT